MQAAAPVEIIGKKELAIRLNWARTTLDRRLKSDPKFPVENHGDQSGGWAFDYSKVRRYLSGAPPPIDPAQLRDAVRPLASNPPAKVTGKRQAITPAKNQIAPQAEEAAVQVLDALKNGASRSRHNGDRSGEEKAPRRSAYHSGEASARQRKDEADAGLKEDKLRELRGELVQKSDVRQTLATIFAGLAHDLDSLPEKIVKTCELRDDAAPGIRAMIDEFRTEMVKRAEALLAEAENVA